MQQQAGALDVAQEMRSPDRHHVRALDQAGDVGDDESS